MTTGGRRTNCNAGRRRMPTPPSLGHRRSCEEGCWTSGSYCLFASVLVLVLIQNGFPPIYASTYSGTTTTTATSMGVSPMRHWESAWAATCVQGTALAIQCRCNPTLVIDKDTIMSCNENQNHPDHDDNDNDENESENDNDHINNDDDNNEFRQSGAKSKMNTATASSSSCPAVLVLLRSSRTSMITDRPSLAFQYQQQQQPMTAPSTKSSLGVERRPILAIPTRSGVTLHLERVPCQYDHRPDDAISHQSYASSSSSSSPSVSPWTVLGYHHAFLCMTGLVSDVDYLQRLLQRTLDRHLLTYQPSQSISASRMQSIQDSTSHSCAIDALPAPITDQPPTTLWTWKYEPSPAIALSSPYQSIMAVRTSQLLLQTLARTLQEAAQWQNSRLYAVQTLWVGPAATSTIARPVLHDEDKLKQQDNNIDDDDVWTLCTLDPSGNVRSWPTATAIGRDAVQVRKRLYHALHQFASTTSTTTATTTTGTVASHEQSLYHRDDGNENDPMVTIATKANDHDGWLDLEQALQAAFQALDISIHFADDGSNPNGNNHSIDQDLFFYEAIVYLSMQRRRGDVNHRQLQVVRIHHHDLQQLLCRYRTKTR